MGIDVDTFLRDLARELGPRTGELTGAVLREMSHDVPWVREHEDTANVASAAVSEHVRTSRRPVGLQGHGRGTSAGHPHGQTPSGTHSTASACTIATG
ncbi:hypothetical protein AB0958_40475 [Streptomyces sp. NPDC006655]|uniref:hypothetical protein n=1 Tax=Streptomyces sp. NPDC006655 TaxID=3156898 RepID=UPI003452A122